MSKLYCITGPAGVGKTTVSEIIAKQLEKSALVEGDAIYNMVRGGYVLPWLEGNHLEVFWENNLDLIYNFLSKGYDVVFNYIISKKYLELLKENLKDFEIKFVVLMVDEETIVKRDRLRQEDCQMGERSIVLLNKFKQGGYDNSNILDTTNLTANETVEQILKDTRFIIR